MFPIHISSYPLNSRKMGGESTTIQRESSYIQFEMGFALRGNRTILLEIISYNINYKSQLNL